MDLVIGRSYRMAQYVGQITAIEGDRVSMRIGDKLWERVPVRDLAELSGYSKPAALPKVAPKSRAFTSAKQKCQRHSYKGLELSGYLQANLIEERADKFFAEYEEVTGVKLTRESKNVTVRPEGSATWANALQFYFCPGAQIPQNLPVEISQFSDGRIGIVQQGATEFCWQLIMEGFRIA
jgi:hypothetical protein